MGKAELEKHLPLLRCLSISKPKIQKAIVHESDEEVIKVLCECAKNTINGNIKLNPAQFKQLKCYYVLLKQLANKKTSTKKKKRILQKGGFLGALLAAAIPTITSVVANAFSSK